MACCLAVVLAGCTLLEEGVRAGQSFVDDVGDFVFNRPNSSDRSDETEEVGETLDTWGNAVDLQPPVDYAPELESFVYPQLTAGEQELYGAILEAVRTRETQTVSLVTSEDDFHRASAAVQADHPEIFWLDYLEYATHTRGDEQSIEVRGVFSYQADYQFALEEQISEAVNAWRSGMPAVEDDFDVARYTYDYLVSRTEYDLDAPDNQTIVSVLVVGRSVCNGYAKAFQFLMHEAGIPCVLVTGEAEGEPHAWVAAKLDGEWYYIDPTWGDAQYLNSVGEVVPDAPINYDYLGVTSDAIAETHTVGDPWEQPECSATADNYFVHEGLYFESADVERIGELIGQGQEAGEESVTVKCASQDVLDELIAELFDEQRIFEYLNMETVYYSTSDQRLTLSIELTS